MTEIAFTLEPVPPFRLDLTAWALRRRADNLIDRWDGQTYRRALRVDAEPVAVAVRQEGTPDAPLLRVTARSARFRTETEAAVKSALGRLLGLEVDLGDFYRLAARDERLDLLARRFRGLKPPRFPTPFEALVNAIVCQQITLTLGIRILGRLAALASAGRGETPIEAAEAGYALPEPRDVVDLTPEALRAISFSRQKARALIEAGRAVVDGRLDFAALAALDDATAVARLRELPGVGRWTAEYVLLRGLGRIEVFPGDDVGARNNLQRWLGLTAPLDYPGVAQVVARWAPFAGLLYFHLLLDRIAESGHLAA